MVFIISLVNVLGVMYKLKYLYSFNLEFIREGEIIRALNDTHSVDKNKVSIN
jgi:hypothetical protein